MNNGAQIMVAGIGSPHGDDQAGWEVARQIERRGLTHVRVKLARTPADLLDWIEPDMNIVICDACRGAGAAGSVHHWEWPCGQLDEIRWSGTHQMSLVGVLALAEQLGKLPEHVQIYGIELQSDHSEETISDIVQSGVIAAVESICEKLNPAVRQGEMEHA
ncbi:hydrogenase maturation protease [Gimesia maris]|uniref:hydrogenase maturation protease n=1 Tax=Gimesia maris TaxID=122 RepID=UPI00241F7F3E|nr:hydrogenase maturation protease [Gimesia maris]